MLTQTYVDLKRELISQQVKYEIAELNSTTALQRFGAPFRSDYGEVAPVDSDLPILRYIFVHHVRHFPFLDQAREKEFWQDKLQVVSQTSTSLCSPPKIDERLVPGKLRKQAYLIFGGPNGRDKEEKACDQSTETG